MDGFTSTVVVEDIYRNLRMWRYSDKSGGSAGVHCTAIGAMIKSCRGY